MEYGEKSGMSYGMRRGMSYFTSALKVTLGAGAALGGVYLFSRVGEKQDTEASLSRLEQMLSELGGTEKTTVEPTVEPTAEPGKGRKK